MLLAIEGGGSHTSVLLTDKAGDLIATYRWGPASPLYAEPVSFQSELDGVLRHCALYCADVGSALAAVGLAAPMNRDVVDTAVARVFGEVPVWTFSEGDVALANAGLRHGMALIAGTGASAFCIDERGDIVTAGGFGPQFDDGGSAYWLGREAVAAAARAADGRGPETILRKVVRDHFRATDLWDIMRQINTGGFVSVQKVATCAPAVCRAAAEGDPVAVSIVDAGAAALTDMAAAVASRTALAVRPVPVVPSGGVFESGDIVLTPLRRHLENLPFPWEMRDPVQDPARGIVIRLKERLNVS